MNFFEELKRRNVFRVGFACTNAISMTACGRSNPINSDTICTVGSELFQPGIVAMTNAIVICHNVDNALRYHL